VIFGRGELTKALLDELTITSEPMTSRELAQAIMITAGRDKRER
jgi:hypothetical protein